jgi:hypothetical protein
MEHMPHITLNWIGILVAAIAAFVFGGVWYGPLFGKKWAKEMGMKMDQKPSKKFMQRAMALQIVGALLTSFVIAHEVQVWRPSAWGIGTDMNDAMYGFYAGFFVWLGFFIPVQFGKVAWENRSWKLFCINAIHDFINLQIIAQILANFH